MSAARRKLGSDLTSADHGCYILACSFAGNDAASPLASTLLGDYLVSVQLTGAGQYLLTLQTLGLQIIASEVNIQSTTANMFHGQVRTITNTGTTNTVLVSTYNNANALQNLGDTERVNVMLFIRKNATSVKRNLLG